MRALIAASSASVSCSAASSLLLRRRKVLGATGVLLAASRCWPAARGSRSTASSARRSTSASTGSCSTCSSSRWCSCRSSGFPAADRASACCARAGRPTPPISPSAISDPAAHFPVAAAGERAGAQLTSAGLRTAVQAQPIALQVFALMLRRRPGAILGTPRLSSHPLALALPRRASLLPRARLARRLAAAPRRRRRHARRSCWCRSSCSASRSRRSTSGW